MLRGRPEDGQRSQLQVWAATPRGEHGHMELTHRKCAIPSGGDYGEQNLPSEFLPIQDKGWRASRSGKSIKKTNGN